jgi:hypothetical protein
MKKMDVQGEKINDEKIILENDQQGGLGRIQVENKKYVGI